MRTASARTSNQRFRATIAKQGPNPYVDVPAALSRALEGHARAGRIQVRGNLRKLAGARGAGRHAWAEFEATLIPAGKGRHRLFVNGAVRNAAGVGVGDRVQVELRVSSPEQVWTPDDVSKALRAARALSAFQALSASHRRELLRYVGEARTPATRRRRIEQAVKQVRGAAGRATATSKARTRPLWTCPKCANAFVNRNQYHGCRRYELDEPFQGKAPEIRALFDRFAQTVQSLGAVRLVAYKDRIGFMVRVRFAAAVPRRRWLDVGLWLARRVEHPRFHKVETIVPYAHVHVTRLTELGQIDKQLAGWTREAYAVGCQEHHAEP